ncbi:ATP-binding protein [Streptomyces sp. V4-01]|uniref:histidine kinase n=1 Tax=Actinacidiphila polyblastidii TaxID=3110430 RepID=A0ABU7PHI3_9ACTN|nr:ATP-binding protein [Streptomyces sp. V4-01]
MTEPADDADLDGVLREVLPDWPERWRYPGLMALALGPGTVAADDCLAAVLDGLAEPPADPEAAAQALVEAGDFHAARRVPGGEAVDVDAAVVQAGVRIERARQQLLRQAARAGLPAQAIADAPPGLVDERLADAEAALAAWTDHVKALTDDKRGSLHQRLLDVLDELPGAGAEDDPADSTASWARSVRDCLGHGELAAAERLITAGPSPSPLAEPRTVSPWPMFPWADHGLDEVLSWYAGGPASTGPEFDALWRPRSEEGAELVDALHSLHQGLNEAAVGRFARALDTFLGEADVRHRVRAADGGFVTWVSGVADHRRIPRLGLPLQLPLYIGPPGWTPGQDGPAVWLVLRTQLQEAHLRAAQRGIAPLEATAVLQLAAPPRSGSGSTAGSRINVLRAVCRRLRVRDVVGALPAPDEDAGPGHPYESHEDLEWWLDMLGVHATAAVADALLYDTGGHPLVLREALCALLAADAPSGAGRSGQKLTLEVLDGWRADAAAQERFHDQVVDALFASDLEAALVLRAVLYIRCVEPSRTLDAWALADLLLPPDADPSVLPVAADAALSRVAAAGLLTGPGAGAPATYAWPNGGLAALLAGAGQDVLRSRLHSGLSDLTELRDRSDYSAPVGLYTVISSYGHKMTSDLRGVQGALERGDQASVREGLSGLSDTIERFGAPNALQEQLNAQSEIDLRTELERRCRESWSNGSGLSEIALAPGGEAAPILVWGIRQLLNLAFNSLLENARRAADERDGGGGRVTVELTVRRRDPVGIGPTVARIDICDNGAGVRPGWLPVLNNEQQRVEGDGLLPIGSGNGVRYARDHIRRHGGTLRFLPADGGGTVARIELPVTRSGPAGA